MKLSCKYFATYDTLSIIIPYEIKIGHRKLSLLSFICFCRRFSVENNFGISDSVHDLNPVFLFCNTFDYIHVALNIYDYNCGIKAELQVCGYSISARLLDIAHLLGCLLMLSLHDVIFNDVKCP